jgi:hypothetical protein
MILSTENPSRQKKTSKLGDNCIVFENFTVSIGDLKVAN